MQLQEQAATLLLNVKTGKPTDAQEAALAGYDFQKLMQELNADHQKKTFWINIYNAYFQLLAAREQVTKPDIYKKRLVQIAGQGFSLDDIEHGILRKNRYKPALGFLPNLFVRRLLKYLAVSEIDYRIHFALNCGAVSCPPIAFYNVEKIENQLETATRSFLESETEIFPEKREIHISRLMLWYLGDFGGFRGLRKILQDKLNIDTRGQKIVFKHYDWTTQLYHFSKVNATAD